MRLSDIDNTWVELIEDCQHPVQSGEEARCSASVRLCVRALSKADCLTADTAVYKSIRHFFGGRAAEQPLT
jgi:hypothetical protein